MLIKKVTNWLDRCWWTSQQDMFPFSYAIELEIKKSCYYLHRHLWYKYIFQDLTRSLNMNSNKHLKPCLTIKSLHFVNMFNKINIYILHKIAWRNIQLYKIPELNTNRKNLRIPKLNWNCEIIHSFVFNIFN